MLFTTVIACLSLSSYTAGAAVLRARQTSGVQSAPFNLILSSTNETLDGSQLSSGHAGAAIEELLIGNQTIVQSPSTIFNFNETVYPGQTSPATGKLVWELHGGNFNVSQALGFSYNPFFDSAVPQFGASLATPLSFTDANELVYYQFQYQGTATEYVAVDRWYACQLSAERNVGYEYFAIVWGLGSRAPTDLTCQKVSIKRVFTGTAQTPA